MIYIEPPYLLPEKTAPERASETPLLKTWLAQLPQGFKSSRDEIAKLINTYLVPCTELLRLELDQPVSPLYLPYISPISPELLRLELDQPVACTPPDLVSAQAAPSPSP